MNIIGESCDHADFLKILPENCKEIASLLYNNHNNNLAVV